ncbi:MAG: FAD-dependent oxidoreductase, partial [bacterium]
WLLTDTDAVKFGFRSEEFKKGVPNAYSVLRVKFDDWAAKEARTAGAMLLTATRVDEVIFEGSQVVGVKTDRPDGDIYAPVVILAEGANPFIARKAGLAREYKTHELALTVKEIISLDVRIIEERFNLNSGDGCTIELLGAATKGLLGYAFIYTNKDSLSIGLGALVSDFIEQKIRPYDLLEDFKMHPAVKPLLAGGKVMEYMSHLIPEAGYRALPKLYADGVMVVGDAAMLTNAVHREGSNFAFQSGWMAGQTAVEAHQKKDFTAKTLGAYRTKLDNSFIMKDLKKYSRLTPYVLSKRKEFLEMYPKLLMDTGKEMLSVDNIAKKEKERRILQMIRRRRSIPAIVSDMYKLWRAMEG